MRGWSYTTTYKIIFILLFLTNCNYKTQKIDPNADRGNGSLSAETLITDDLVMNYSLRTCLNCHAGSKPPTLDTASTVKANIDKVIQDLEKDSMPPISAGYSSLTACQKDLVKAWANNSARTIGEIASCKNTGVGTNPVLPILPIELMPLNFETLKTKILLPKCVVCHNPDGDDWEAALIPFTSYSEIASGEFAKYWTAPAASSRVIEDIVDIGAGVSMPPVDSGLKPLSVQEIDFISRWIDAGKPE